MRKLIYSHSFVSPGNLMSSNLDIILDSILLNKYLQKSETTIKLNW
jgi:hypothetical protein